MKIIKTKQIQILSDGSLFFGFKCLVKPNQFIFHEKDNKNFFMNKKNTMDRTKTEDFSNYKKKYLN